MDVLVLSMKLIVRMKFMIKNAHQIDKINKKTDEKMAILFGSTSGYLVVLWNRNIFYQSIVSLPKNITWKI
jgi:hypothetical protein